MKKAIRILLACVLLAKVSASWAVGAYFDLYVSEYVNHATGHFVVLDPYEAGYVDNGSAGPNWVRTGNYFTLHNFDLMFTPVEWTWFPVCRFYSPRFQSHFFTASYDECEGVKKNSDWVYEKIAFRVHLKGPDCQNELPVYRLYNNGYPFDVSHRFTADVSTRDALVGAGWKYEGVAWCALNAGFQEPGR